MGGFFITAKPVGSYTKIVVFESTAAGEPVQSATPDAILHQRDKVLIRPVLVMLLRVRAIRDEIDARVQSLVAELVE